MEKCHDCEENKIMKEQYYDLVDFLQDYLGDDWSDFKGKFENRNEH